MGMVVRTNTPAMNANRQLGINSNQVSKSLEKLSSGFKINRAADDASGLAISEKMKAQIKGLETASANSQDGISLIQTAEGGAQEIHDMLNRMTELATKSANGTIQDEVDREAIQREVDDLNNEITRIAQSTNFNGINLLDGKLSGKVTAGSANSGKQFIDPTGTNANFAGASVDAKAAKHVFDVGQIDGDVLQFEAVEISFTNAKGEQKTFTLAENVVAGLITGKADTLANVLNGSDTTAFVVGPINNTEGAAAFEEFKELFNVAGTAGASGAANAGFLTVQAKEAGGATFGSIKVASAANQGAAITAVGTAAAAVQDVDLNGATAGSTKAEVAGYQVDLDTIATGDQVKINGKTYEFTTNAGTALTDPNATRIVMGADNRTSAENLIKQLKKDGLDAKLDNTATAATDGKILFTKPEQLEEKQRGAEISGSTDNINIKKQEAVKGSIDATIGVGTGGAANLKLVYTDANGKTKTKEIAYTGTAVAGTNGEAMAKALREDAELNELFDISFDGTDKLTLSAKSKGADVPQVLSIASSDILATNMPATGITRVEGRDLGKSVSMTKQPAVGDSITVNGKTYEFVDDESTDVKEGNNKILIGATANDTIENLSKQLTKDNVDVTLDKGTGTLYFSDKKNEIVPPEEKTGGLTLQIGDTSDGFNKVTVSVDDLSAVGIGTFGLDVSNQVASNKSIDTIKAAINKVSTNRANLGSLQNRLEHTINNLDTTAENMTAANSRIRDTDMAKEMMNYTKTNVLVQAAQAMLAQANQQPQSILQLLQ